MIGVESDRDSAANAVGAFHSCVWARTKPKPAACTAHRERPAHVGMHHEREPASEIGCMPIVACTRLQPREGKARVNVNRWQSMAITGTHVQSLAITCSHWNVKLVSKPARRGRGALYQAVPTEPTPLVNRSQLEGRVGRAPPPPPPPPLVAAALGAVVGTPAWGEDMRLCRSVAPQCNSSPQARMKRTASITGGAGGAGHEGSGVSTSVTFPGPSTSSSSKSPPISPSELPSSASSSSQ